MVVRATCTNGGCELPFQVSRLIAKSSTKSGLTDVSEKKRMSLWPTVLSEPVGIYIYIYIYLFVGTYRNCHNIILLNNMYITPTKPNSVDMIPWLQKIPAERNSSVYWLLYIIYICSSPLNPPPQWSWYPPPLCGVGWFGFRRSSSCRSSSRISSSSCCSSSTSSTWYYIVWW